MSRITAGLMFFLSFFLSLRLNSGTSTSETGKRPDFVPDKPDGTGTAIIMTGAAARITQQAALLEELYNRGLLNEVVFISGVSAGAINAVALNAILEGKLTWDEYKKTLFSLENNDVFTLHDNKKLPVNTEPVRKLFTQFFEEKLGYKRMGDLPVMTEISFTNYRDIRLAKNVYRMCSRKINKESDTTLSVVDVLMASTAIPFAFPPVRIENVSTIPDLEYVDGGVGLDYVPFKALLEFQNYRGENVRKVYIISRKSGIANVSEELKALGINRKGMDMLGNSLDNILKRLMINRLTAFAREAPEMIMSSYVWIPDFNQDFLMFSFNKLKEQYTITKSWAQNNDPIPLGDFLLYNKMKKKKN
ncbi:MAG TPA: patatin-like phospholipase family protein [Bacteroidales bacterium]|nr:patatin-like phospholipase family protein [Bacteroidales bacterium]